MSLIHIFQLVKDIGLRETGILVSWELKLSDTASPMAEMLGMQKEEANHNIFDTGKFLNRPPLVSVSNTSGLAGIALWINSYYHLPCLLYTSRCV